MTREFKIPGPPMGKARPRFTKLGHAYTPEKTRNYENTVAILYKAIGGKLITPQNSVQISIEARYSIPKGDSKARRSAKASGAIKPLRKPDVDNIAKIIMDALNGVAYEDDKQVTQLTVSKTYTDGEPYVYVWITAEESEQKSTTHPLK